MHGGETHWAFVPDFVANAGQKTGCLFSCWTKIVYRQVKTGCLKLEKNRKKYIYFFYIKICSEQLKSWYFVTKIILTYCEKKFVSFRLFAIILSIFRLFKGQLYLNNMLRVNK